MKDDWGTWYIDHEWIKGLDWDFCPICGVAVVEMSADSYEPLICGVCASGMDYDYIDLDDE